jgi:hypothetical protein
MRRLKKRPAPPVEERMRADLYTVECSPPLALRLRTDVGKLPASELIAYQLPEDVSRVLVNRRLAVLVVGDFAVVPDLVLDEIDINSASLHSDFWLDIEAATSASVL